MRHHTVPRYRLINWKKSHRVSTFRSITISQAVESWRVSGEQWRRQVLLGVELASGGRRARRIVTDIRAATASSQARAPSADATRDLFVRPRWRTQRNVRRLPPAPVADSLARHRPYRARLITNVKCYRTQPTSDQRPAPAPTRGAASSAPRAALHNNKTWYLKRNVLLTPCSCADANLR